MQSSTEADAHVLGIVHRDLKPANLFRIRRSDGQLSIRVLDFGISKIKIAVDPTPPLRSLRADAPHGLEALLETCLAKDRGRRFQTVGDLGNADIRGCSMNYPSAGLNPQITSGGSTTARNGDGFRCARVP